MVVIMSHVIGNALEWFPHVGHFEVVSDSGISPRGRPRRRLHLGKLGRVRRYRSMQPSIVQAQPIMLDGGTTPGRLPPARGAARGRVHRPPSVPSSTGTPKSRT